MRFYHLTVLYYGKHAFEYDHKAFAACVDHTGFFENRQQLGRFVESLFGTVEHGFKNGYNVLALRDGGIRVFGGDPCNRKYRALGRLHDGIIRRINTELYGVAQRLGVHKLFALETLGKSAEKKRQDNARISSCTAQKRRCVDRRYLSGSFIVEQYQFSCGIADCHRHVCSGITVRNGENIKLIDALFAVHDVICTGQQRVTQCVSVYQN